MVCEKEQILLLLLLLHLVRIVVITAMLWIAKISSIVPDPFIIYTCFKSLVR